MWAGSMALNGITSSGTVFEGFNHLTEHVISAFYDLTHGIGLAILAPHWMEYILDDTTAGKLADFARNVWDVIEKDNIKAAEKGIQKLREFYRGLGLPLNFSEVGIGPERFKDIAEKAVRGETLGGFKKLTRQDVLNILTSAQ